MSKTTLQSLMLEHGKPGDAALESITWQSQNIEKLNSWFKREYAITLEAPLNTDPEKCYNEDAPLVTYVQQEWRVVPEDTRVELRKSLESDEEPADDYTVVCTIINDTKVIEFLQTEAPEMEPGVLIVTTFYLLSAVREMAGVRFGVWEKFKKGELQYDALFSEQPVAGEV